jgi:hypothetical protein
VFTAFFLIWYLYKLHLFLQLFLHATLQFGHITFTFLVKSWAEIKNIFFCIVSPFGLETTQHFWVTYCLHLEQGVASGIGRGETSRYLSIRKYNFCHLYSFVRTRQSETIVSNQICQNQSQSSVNADINISLMAVVYVMYTFSYNYGGVFFH